MSEAVPFDDRGLTLGDGLFETLLAREGEPVALEAHLERMAQGCKTLGLPRLDRRQARRRIGEALAACPESRAAVRLTLTAGSGGRGLDRPATPAPRLFATAAPAPPPAGPARLVVAGVRRNEHSPTSRLKTLAYLDNVLARAEAAASGADEALMLNTSGEMACAAAANLFWLRDGGLETPALACGVLAGVVRGEVLVRAQALGVAVRLVRAGPERLTDAEAVFLTNTLVGVRPVSAVGARAYGPHALVDELARGLS